ncbi:IS30 family transposase [Ochrobactrum sp. MR28]|nr:IS30 family transposase [Ochrobactrum sp. MR28]MBX8819030.1 IS30 family transposase [Ochrobactrum sp. MR31]
MKRKFTQSEKETCWSLWREGLGFSDIGRVLSAKPGSVFTLLREHGGVTLPRPKRSQRHLNLAEREEISISLAANISIRQIAYSLRRSPSTISREINKNGGLRKYRAHLAENAAWKRAKRPKPAKLTINIRLKNLVIEKLQLKWSPEQISGWLKIEFPFHEDMQISSETIYKSLYIRSRKLLDIALMNNLRRAHKIRQSKRLSRRGDRGTISIVNGISIHKRPSEIDERSIAGHWEGDLISGSGNTHIATLVDRKTRFTMLLKLDGKDAASVTQALIKQFNNIPKILRKSLTWDRGMELAKHQEFTDATGMPVYFCDPQSPWQRGTNENTNQLLRQYFPKKTCLKQHSSEMLKNVADQLNRRPRKTLRYTTPQTAILYAVALTG